MGAGQSSRRGSHRGSSERHRPVAKKRSLTGESSKADSPADKRPRTSTGKFVKTSHVDEDLVVTSTSREGRKKKTISSTDSAVHLEEDEAKTTDEVRDPNERLKFEPGVEIEAPRRMAKEKKESKTKKMSVGGKKIKATAGPRAICGSDNFYSTVQEILDKWTGENDRGNLEDFYLIQFKGLDDINVDHSDDPAYADFWVSTSVMIDCYPLISHFNRQLEKLGKKAVKLPGKEGIYYRADQELENDDSDEEKVVSIKEKASSSSSSQSKRNTHTAKRTSSRTNKESDTDDEVLVGFDRGLPAKEIHGVCYHEEANTLIYAVEFKGDKRVDFVSSEICQQRCPELLIDYLVTLFQFPELTLREMKSYMKDL